MSLTRFLATTLTLCAIAPTAFADVTDCTARYKTLALEHIDRAKANGWSQIGELTLDRIRSDVESPTYRFVCSRHLTFQEENRKDAYNSPALKTIHMNLKYIEALDESLQGAVALHEVFGIKRYRDHKFQITTRVLEMEKTPFHADSPLHKELLSPELLARGGSDGVGGGGDGDLIEIKTFLFEATTKVLSIKTALEREQILAEILELDITLFSANLATLTAQIFVGSRGFAKVEVGDRSLLTAEGNTSLILVALEAAKFNHAKRHGKRYSTALE
jgi:hypothetical protein